MAKKAVTEIGATVPQNLKFGLIVTMAIFWADVLRSALRDIFDLSAFDSATSVNLILAILATLIVFLVLLTYRRIVSNLKKIRM